MIQNALNRCPANYAVKISPAITSNSIYTGPIFIPSSRYLWIDKNVTVKPIQNLALFNKDQETCGSITSTAKKTCHAIFNLKNTKNNGIIGEGVIYGNGDESYQSNRRTAWEVNQKATAQKRYVDFPNLIDVENSTNALIQGLNLTQSADTHIEVNKSANIRIKDITIQTFTSLNRTNGISITASHHINANNLNIRTGGAHVLVTTTLPHEKTEYIELKNLKLYEGRGLLFAPNYLGSIAHVLVEQANFHKATNGVWLVSNMKMGGKFSDFQINHTLFNETTHAIRIDTSFGNNPKGTTEPDIQNISFNHFTIYGLTNLIYNGINAIKPPTIYMSDGEIIGPYKTIRQKIHLKETNVTYRR
ncbi:glycosyl hydrolase family 28 protein [Basilea psittacipulmonis]|nr:glycosyl hydrolase family 28 protein [Basilea psittacipulmonis]